jgi:hypothetical protein
MTIQSYSSHESCLFASPGAYLLIASLLRSFLCRSPRHRAADKKLIESHHESLSSSNKRCSEIEMLKTRHPTKPNAQINSSMHIQYPFRLASRITKSSVNRFNTAERVDYVKRFFGRFIECFIIAFDEQALSGWDVARSEVVLRPMVAHHH